MDVNMNTINDSFNISAASLNLTCSTPFKVPRRKTQNTQPKKFVRPVCDQCNICGKEYRCHRSYLNHMRQHSIKEGASRFPKASQIVQHCSDTICESFEKLRQLPAFGSSGKKYQELLLKIISNNLETCPEWKKCFQTIHDGITNNIGEYKILMPSAMVSLLVKNCDELLSNIDLRYKLCDMFQKCVECDTHVCHCFIADYVLMLVTKIFLYYSSCLKTNVNVQENVEHELTLEVKETIHYVSGAVVRSFYKKSILFPKNVFWRRIGELITSKLLESETVSGPPRIVKGWTIAQSKGKLFFVSGTLYDFFLGVTQILEKTTGNTLRVDAMKVIESVCGSVVVILWDEAVGDSLSETASYDLMCAMTKSFCCTYCAGKKNQLLNSIRVNKAEASLALRARVAPKS